MEKMDLSLLYPDKTDKELQRIRNRRRRQVWILAAGTLLAAGVLGTVWYLKRNDSSPVSSLSRGAYGSGDQEYEVEVEGLEDEPVSISLTLAEQALSEAYAEALLDDAEEELTAYLSETYNMDHISGGMDLPESLDLVEIEWHTSDELVMNEAGELLARPEEIPAEGYDMELYANLSVGTYGRSLSYPIHISPGAITDTDRLVWQFTTSLQEAEAEGRQEETYDLPEEWDTYRLQYHILNDDWDYLLQIALFLILAVACIIYLLRKEPEHRAEKRSEELKRDYPQFVNQMTALLMTGYTVRMAWGRMCDAYQERRNRHKRREYVYEEMLLSRSKLTMGQPETQVYHEFADRCGHYDYQRMMEILINRIRYGEQNQTLLVEEIIRTREIRKDECLRLARQAETRMLIPMFGMFIIVLLILFVPAFGSMNLTTL